MERVEYNNYSGINVMNIVDIEYLQICSGLNM